MNTMKKLWKKLTMLAITISGMMYSTLSFAAIDGVDPNKTFKTTTGTNATNAVSNFGSNILGIVSTGASVLAVIILIVLGIKYMMGSAEEKAEYKKTMIPYLIGAVLLFAAVNLAGWIVGIAQTIA